MMKHPFRFTLFLLMCFIFPLVATAQTVTIPDPNLRAAIESALGKASGATITALDMATLTSLEAYESNISNLTGLEGATNLTWLNLYYNSISDISPLAGLTNLTTLNLLYNNIGDISPLAGLTNLRTLNISYNNISDISPLAGLTNLTTLELHFNSISDISPLAGLTNLTTLELGGNNISDISPLAGLTNLTRLYLYFNSISDISPLAGLTNLTTLYLRYNNISDISPLVANTGLGSGDTVDLRGNYLLSINPTPINTHIPTLQSRGVTVEFDDRRHLNVGELYTVRLIYFLPSDRQPRPDIDTEMDTLIKEVQQFYADSMESYGFGGKTFRFEADMTGKAVVHRMAGQFIADYYEEKTVIKVTEEIEEQFNTFKTIYLVVVDSGYFINGAGGKARTPSSGNEGIAFSSGLSFQIAAHELGHTFGLRHDFRSDAYIMSYGNDRRTLSKCAAERLDVHRYFNTNRQGQNFFRTPAHGTTRIEMLPPSLASPPNAIRLRFEVTDTAGLHRAQLLKFHRDPESWQLVDCKRLNGTSSSVEFVTTALLPWEDHNSVSLQIMNVNGSISWSQPYPIDVTSLLPPPEVVSIPDANLAAVVRETLGLSPGVPLTTHAMLELRRLSAPTHQITNLTGLEHAHRLKSLELTNNTLSDISVLSGLTQLTTLNLANNSISDISALSGLIQLTKLYLWDNPLSYASINTHIPAMQARGIEVHFHNQPHPALLKISGDNQTGTALTSLPQPFVVEAQDANGSVLEGISVTFAVAAGGGTLSVTNTTTDANGRAQAHLTLGSTAGTSTISVAAAVISQPVSFAATAILLSDPVMIPDAALRAKIAAAFGKPSDGVITVGEMLTLTALNANNANISELTGLSYAPNLKTLSLDNSPSDMTYLAKLPELKTLSLNNNNLSDVAFLAGVSQLTTLSLDNNNLSDISTIVGLTELKTLHLKGNPLSYSALHTHIPAMEANGVVVIADPRTPTTLLKISEVHGVAGAGLPVRVVVQDEKGLRFPGVPVTFTITAGGGHLSALTATTDSDGVARTTLTLGETPGVNTVRVVAAEGTTDSFTITGIDVNVPVTVPDAALRARIAETLSKPDGIQLTAGELLELMTLDARKANIQGLTGLEHAHNLKSLKLEYTSISDISALSGLTKLTTLDLGNNSISDISALSELTQLTKLYLWGNPLSYASIYTHIPAMQAKGIRVWFDPRTPMTLVKILGDGQQATINTPLPHPFVVEVRDQFNRLFSGVPVTFTVTAGGGRLNVTSTRTDANGRAQSTLTLGSDQKTNTVSVSAAEIEQPVTFDALSHEFRLSVPVGISLIHVPLKVTTVDGVEKPIESVADLYDALGGAATVNLLGTHDAATQRWFSYSGDPDKDPSGAQPLTDEKGIIASMKAPVTVDLFGAALGANGRSVITLYPGWNVVGVPLRDSKITRVSDLFALEGIENNVSAITVSDNGKFKTIRRVGDDGDINVIGGQSFILKAQATATATISGEGWYNTTTKLSAPAITGIQVTDTTPVLALRGSIVASRDGWGKLPWSGQWISSGGERGRMPHLQPGRGFRVKVKNLSAPGVDREVTSRSAVTTGTGTEGIGYRLTVVDIEAGRAAKIGDILEISAQSTNPFVGVESLQYTVTAEDVKRSWIQLPALVAYEIPTETELLANYPNPFNPETWIPYRLAEDAFVTLTIYDSGGQVVRTLEVGHRIAAVYESRSKAIYWDGKNALGEGVASGIYFYALTAGDYSATRKMVILK